MIPKIRLLGSALALAVAATTAAAKSSYRNVDQLWAGFDPRALPLDAKVLKETKEGGIVLRTVEYTSEIGQGFPVRIVCYYAFSEGGKNLPAVMHLHGGGQNASRGYVEHWAKRGYAALSVDWGGKALENNPANGKTDWGPLPYNQNSKDGHSVYNLTPNARSNAWYHWAIAARRGITFLEQQPEVDASRIGLFGISMGGTLTWIVAGIDHRLRCAAPVVGTGIYYRPLPDFPNSEYEPSTMANPLWSKTIDPYAYAGRIRCPLFFLSAANDFHARIDLMDLMLAKVPADLAWQSYTPHYSHHIDGPEAPALDSWMDQWLKDGPAWPKSPRASLQLDMADHVPVMSVQPDRGAEVAGVNVYYSTGLAPQSRFWRTVAATADGDAWIARLPLTAIEDRGLLAYANIAYRSGLIVSTRLASATADQLRQSHVALDDEPSSLIDDFSRGSTDWWVPDVSPSVLLSEMVFFRSVEGPEGKAAITWVAQPEDRWRFFTRKVGDPKWRGPAGAGLGFSLFARDPNSVVVMVAENFESPPLPNRVFAATAKVQGGKWEAVQLPMSDFRDIHDGSALANWDAIDVLGIAGQYSYNGGHVHLKNKVLGSPWHGPAPAIADVRWIQPQ